MKRLHVALAISVVVNLFLLGVLAGGAVWLRNTPSVIAAGSLRVIGAELPRAERRAFRAALRQTRAGVRGDIEASRTERRQAADLLRHSTPDRAAIVAALARARDSDLRVRAAVELRAVDFTLSLPPTDRQRVADAMTRRAEGGRGAGLRRDPSARFAAASGDGTAETVR